MLYVVTFAPLIVGFSVAILGTSGTYNRLYIHNTQILAVSASVNHCIIQVRISHQFRASASCLSCSRIWSWFLRSRVEFCSCAPTEEETQKFVD